MTAKKQEKAHENNGNETVAKMAHEFRSRLAVVQGSVDNVLAGVFGRLNNEQKKNLQIAMASVERLSTLVEDFLATFDSAEGKIPIHLEKTSLNTLVRHSIESVESLAYREGITVTAQLPEKRVEIYCDRAKIEQVLLNLFRNSIKFTPRGGVIEVTARDRGGEAEVSVADTGVGIPEEKFGGLFSRRPARASGGGSFRTSGLGLVIVKEILDAHKCGISVKSRLGEGTTFTFNLPKT